MTQDLRVGCLLQTHFNGVDRVVTGGRELDSESCGQVLVDEDSHAEAGT